MARNGGIADEELPYSSIPREEWRHEEQKKPMVPPFKQTLGLEELLSLKVWRASVAELLGTALLVFAVDTIVISSIQTKTDTPNIVLSILIGLTLTIVLLATFPISGGHVNPVITFSAALLGLISYSRAFIYILAQCVGAVLGALALRQVVGNNIEEKFSLGGCTLTVYAPSNSGLSVVGIETSSALWLEILSTFFFLFASVWVAFDDRQRNARGPIFVFSVIGAVVGIMAFVSTTVTTKTGYAGVGMNPARCIGPAIVRGGHLWDRHWVFWVGPAIACVAFYLYIKIIPREHLRE
ncbi:hypothetical protein ACHQM5_008183 [Ranunculus cassubicifolius]